MGRKPIQAKLKILVIALDNINLFSKLQNRFFLYILCYYPDRDNMYNSLSQTKEFLHRLLIKVQNASGNQYRNM